MLHSVASIERARRVLGYEPKVDWRSGLAKTVDWYLDHADWVARVMDGSYRGERLGAA